MKLYENGVYLVNGTELIEDTSQNASRVGMTKEEAAKNTIAYGILKAAGEI